MSLIVGIRCSDSVILAASGPARLPSSDGWPLARQRERRLRVVAGQAVLGVSGHDGLAQEMALSLESRLGAFAGQEPAEEAARARVRESLAAPVQRTVAIHRTLQGLPGLGHTTDGFALCHALVALPLSDSLRLYVMDPDCSVTEITEELSWATVGKGRAETEPFLAFLRKVVWQGEPPTAAKGELAAYWALRHAIETSPALLSEPVQVIVMELAADGSIKISERDESEIAALQRRVEANEQAIRESLQAERSEGRAPPRGSAPGSAPRGPESRAAKKRVPEVRVRLGSPERGGPRRW